MCSRHGRLHAGGGLLLVILLQLDLGDDLLRENLLDGLFEDLLRYGLRNDLLGNLLCNSLYDDLLGHGFHDSLLDDLCLGALLRCLERRVLSRARDLRRLLARNRVAGDRLELLLLGLCRLGLRVLLGLLQRLQCRVLG